MNDLQQGNRLEQSGTVTGAAVIDWLLGFVLTAISPALFCFGGMIPIVFYFSRRARFPALCRGIWAALWTLGIGILAAVLYLLATADHGKKSKYPEPPKPPPANRMHSM